MSTRFDLEATATAPGASERAAPGAIDAAATPRMPRVGDAMGRYRLERVLGQGGMGVVFAAHDTDLDRRVAIKVLRLDSVAQARARLLREARALAKISHANVVTVHEVGTFAGVDFVVMELLDGGSLDEWLRQSHPLPEVWKKLRAAGNGLAAAHAAGLVHRDFKPSNVLLGKDARVVVTDFGLARGIAPVVVSPPPASVNAVSLPPPTNPASTSPPATAVGLADTMTPAAPTPSANLAHTLTHTGALLGTPAYMAPEQHRGDDVGPAADQFAFAVALWEGVTGQRPYRATTMDEQRSLVEAGPPDPGKLPLAMRAVLARALAPSPADRWPDLATMLTTIDKRFARRRVATALALVAVVAVAAITAVVALPEQERAPTAAAVALVTTIDAAAVATNVARATIERWAADISAFSDGARLVPALSEETKEMIGFKIYAIKPDTQLAALGLANGDTLRAINGIAIASADKLRGALATLGDADTLRLEISRRGTSTSLIYAIR